MIGRPVKISIIIPVYNVENYLSTCLTSCINQTLNDIEILCINDGSTDSSLQILQEFAEHDYRIRVIDKSNGGVSSARNVGLKEACGEFIMFLDADDYLEPKACERVWIEKLEAPTDIIVFGSEPFPQSPAPSKWYFSVLRTPTRRYWEFTPQVLFGEPSTRPFIWHQAFRKEILEKNKIAFDERIRQGEDMVFLLQVYPHAKYFCFIQDCLHHYRWYREGSAMWKFNGDMDHRIEEHIAFVEIICEYWKEMGWLKQYGKEYLEWMLEFIVCDIRDPQVQRAEAHLISLNEVIHKYQLEKHLDHVSPRFRIYVKNLKRGRV